MTTVINLQAPISLRYLKKTLDNYDFVNKTLTIGFSDKFSLIDDLSCPIPPTIVFKDYVIIILIIIIIGLGYKTYTLTS